MPEPRTVLERELERVPLRPFTLESFHRSVERRRRNARIASGALGVAIAIAIAIATTRLSGPTDGVGDPSPTPSPSSTTTTFRSDRYGYSIDIPVRWTARPSDTPWTSGPLIGETADLVVREGAPATIVLEAGSMLVPESMTESEWLEREERRRAREIGFGRSCAQEHAVSPTTVDGIAGRFSPDCSLILVVSDGRGYVFRLNGDIATDLQLRAAVRSIELHPEEV